jgi:hypothetical protein
MASTPISLEIPGTRRGRSVAARRAVAEQKVKRPWTEEPSPFLHAGATRALILAAQPLHPEDDLA